MASAEEIFAQFLLDRAAGLQEDFESVCEKHADSAAELTDMESRMQPLVDAFDRLIVEQGVADRLRREHGEDIDPEISLGEGDDEQSSTTIRHKIDRLASQGMGATRYGDPEEIARGGMGAIFRVWDRDLRRRLAMKVMLKGAAESDTADFQSKIRLARFLEEAQITGQLDHPGIVPVHELGIDSNGRLYFTMRLVRGEDLRAILKRVHSDEDEDWNHTRALGVILRVCEALAFAHAKGVIHRDLKPANIMVGRFGETYVMDWGLAKVVGRHDLHDMRLRSFGEESAEMSRIDTDRGELDEEDQVVTLDGDVLGTPIYMSPEQASGRIEDLSPQSDVYAVGAMLYHLVTGQRPYLKQGERVPPHVILASVRLGPPTAIAELAPDIPAELVAICEKAMAREQGDRYLDMLSMADDLRAYLEGRVVGAYESGAVAEAKNWIRRNRGLAASLAATLLLAVGGLAAVLSVQWRGKRLLQDEFARAEEMKLLAENRADELEDVLAREEVFADDAKLQMLGDKVGDLWPCLPDRLPELENWLAQAAELRGNWHAHEERLSAIRSLALPYSEAEKARDAQARSELFPRIEEKRIALRGMRVLQRRDGEQAHPAIEDEARALEEEIADLERLASDRLSFSFENVDDYWLHLSLLSIRDARESFAKTILHIDSSSQRARQIAEVEESPATARLWAMAREDIATSAIYGGLDLAPQVGLLPLRKDPATGLWEFADLLSGEPPEVDPRTGEYVMTPDTGAVLALLPGGPFETGSRAPDEDHPIGTPYVDEARSGFDAILLEVRLDPFFMGKFETTQAQYERMMGTNPSMSTSKNSGYVEAKRLILPVENIDLLDARECARRMNAALPTQVQLEYGIRAGTTTPYFTGEDRQSVLGYGNFSDRSAYDEYRLTQPDWNYDTEFDDGFGDLSVVGTLKPNAFGLHDVIGNVSEWCDDPCEAPGFLRDLSGGDARSSVRTTEERYMYRGGSWAHDLHHLRSANRNQAASSLKASWLGFRVARAIEPR